MTSSRQLTLLVAVPPISVACLWVVVLLVSGITGQHPVWRLQPRNLAEAAAFRDGAAVVRFAAHEDVNRPADVREGVIGRKSTLTPIEAGAATREREVVRLLFDLGARPDALVWQKAYCISDADSVRELLAEHRPQDARDDCPAN
jgi:hypothetical protein